MYLIKGKFSFILFISILLLNSLLNIMQVYSQEEGDLALKRWIWYYSQRAYPYDTIPGNAYENAVAQRDALIQSNGYQLPTSANWTHIGPMPFLWTNTELIPRSCRVNNIVYDPDDPQGNFFC